MDKMVTGLLSMWVHMDERLNEEQVAEFAALLLVQIDAHMSAKAPEGVHCISRTLQNNAPPGTV